MSAVDRRLLLGVAGCSTLAQQSARDQCVEGRYQFWYGRSVPAQFFGGDDEP